MRPNARQVAEAKGKQSGTISNLDFSVDGRYTPTHVVVPHDGLRPFHEKSTYLRAINFKALCGANSSTPPPQFRGSEIFVVSVDGRYTLRSGGDYLENLL